MPYKSREQKLQYEREFMHQRRKKEAAKAKQIKAERDFYKAFFWELMKYLR